MDKITFYNLPTKIESIDLLNFESYGLSLVFTNNIDISKKVCEYFDKQIELNELTHNYKNDYNTVNIILPFYCKGKDWLVNFYKKNFLKVWDKNKNFKLSTKFGDDSFMVIELN